MREFNEGMLSFGCCFLWVHEFEYLIPQLVVLLWERVELSGSRAYIKGVGLLSVLIHDVQPSFDLTPFYFLVH